MVEIHAVRGRGAGGPRVHLLISLALRYGLPLPALIGKSSASVAFAMATVLASLITYPLNALFVFGKKRSATAAIATTAATS